MVQERAGAVRFSVRVQPRASRTEIVGVHGEALKVRVHAPPVDGAANDAVVTMLAERLQVARSQVQVISGHTSRTKVVEVSGVPAQSVHGLVAS